MVGWGGLNRDPEAPDWGIEVSYVIARSHWGLGLAGELVAASLNLAFRDLGLPEVCAFTRPANHASRRVLTRAGFTLVRHVAALERDQYAIRRASWRGAPGDGRA